MCLIRDQRKVVVVATTTLVDKMHVFDCDPMHFNSEVAS